MFAEEKASCHIQSSNKITKYLTFAHQLNEKFYYYLKFRSYILEEIYATEKRKQRQ